MLITNDSLIILISLIFVVIITSFLFYLFLTSLKTEERFIRAFSLAILVGFILFCLGFFGPMIAEPQSAQGPMLGIFITGPFGLILGFIIGLIIPIKRK